MRVRWDVLGALTVGSAVGWIGSTAASCAPARADDVATETCDAHHHATHAYPGKVVADLTQVTVIGTYQRALDDGTTAVPMSFHLADGKVIATCADIGTFGPSPNPVTGVLFTLP